MSYSNIEHSVNNEEYILFLHIDLDVYLYICSTASEEGQVISIVNHYLFRKKKNLFEETPMSRSGLINSVDMIMFDPIYIENLTVMFHSQFVIISYKMNHNEGN